MDTETGENLFAPSKAKGHPLHSKRSRSYYDILEVGRNADRAEIRRSYIRLKGTLDKSHGAAYSLLEPGQSNALLGEIEEAYRYLDDDYLRKKYDLELDRGSHSTIDDVEIKKPARRHTAKKSAENAHNEAIQEKVHELIESAETINGPLLRQIRETIGVNKNELQTYLKISHFFIDALEDDVYENLPPPVYVRGFVKSLLEYLGVTDGKKIIESYSESYTNWKKKQEKKKS